MKLKTVSSLIIGGCVSAAALYFAFRNVPFNDLLIYVASINYFWIVPAVFFMLASFVLRVFRWQVILEPVGKPGFWRVFHPLMIGFMLNCIFPGRAGEVARPAILQKRDNIPFFTGLATIAAERLFDLVIMTVSFGIVFTLIQIDPGNDIIFGKYRLNDQVLKTVAGGMIAFSMVIAVAIIVFSMETTQRFINRVIIKIPALFFFADNNFRKKIEKKLCMPMVGFVENFARGFFLLKNPVKMCVCAGLSVVIWGLIAFSYYTLSFGCPGIALTFNEMFAVMIIVCFFIALPSVPGFWGIWEAGGVFALSLFGVMTKDAAGFMLANHVIFMFPIIIIGLASAMIAGINIRQVSCGREDLMPDQ